MRIAVDAMGGDYAPGEVVRGVVELASQPEFNDDVILVGDQERLRTILCELGGAGNEHIVVQHASEVIAMDEHPAHAIRKKRDSSLVICGRMVKDGEVDGTISAGNTGAAMAMATLGIGRIPGIDRPAIATQLPTLKGDSLLLDAGANVECTPENLLQFALMGAVYAEKVMGIPEPTIGLLSVGSEESKGNDLTKATHALLKNSSLRFKGNVEGKDVFEHTTDVIICDGFVGNVLLKTGEGMAEMILGLLMTELDSMEGDLLIKMQPVLYSLLRKLDYAERGGAPLVGVNGVSIISHGRSKARAIANAVRTTISAAKSGYVTAIKKELPTITGERHAA
ncbi:MAG: phosphate acyltransferase PlsX [Capsulimonadaceae bacterium]|nr:phosphate acyltransferase PlsX [Capsulimonadaceae bacterium]